jgi:hypothetical protein
MGKRIAAVPFYLFAALVVSLCLLSQRLYIVIQLPFYLVAGWALFLRRVVPLMTLSWVGLFTAGICLLGLTWTLHQFLRWLYSRTKPDARSGQEVMPRVWWLRWTLSSVGVVVLMFVAGIAATGITHQTAWLFISPEPIVLNGRVLFFRGSGQQDSANALQLYHDAEQHFPAGSTFDAQGRPLHGWQTLLLPYLGSKYLGEKQADLYARIDLTLPWNHPKNVPAMQTPVESYVILVPSSPDEKSPKDAAGFALTDFAGNVHVLGGIKPLAKKDITDGLANTILAGEVSAGQKPWGYPMNWRDPALGLGTSPTTFGFSPSQSRGGRPIPGGAHFIFADGSTRFVKSTVDPRVLRALSTPNGGEKVELPE